MTHSPEWVSFCPLSGGVVYFHHTHQPGSTMDIIELVKGSTYQETLLWLSDADAFVNAASATATAPVTITAPGHNLMSNQPVRLECVSPAGHPLDGLEALVEVLDDDTLLLPGVNGHCWPAVTSPFVLRYQPRADLTGSTARMQVRDRNGGTIHVELTTENGGILIDSGEGTVKFRFQAEVTAALTIRRGVFDLEIEDADGFVVKLLAGVVIVRDEVTV